MIVKLWIWTKTRDTENFFNRCNHQKETLQDLTIQPFGETPIIFYELAPKIILHVDRDSQAKYPRIDLHKDTITYPSRSPLKGTVTLDRNGDNVPFPEYKDIKSHEITEKDKLTITVTDGSIVTTITIVVISIIP